MKEEYNTPKRRLLLETGKRLFWKYGFKRVSVEEICRETNVSKMTFYRCFENKIELAKTIFSIEVKLGVEKFNNIINSDMISSEKLKMILVMKMEGTNNISKEFLNDFYNSPDAELKAFVENSVRTSFAEIISGYRFAQEKGWFRKDMKPEFLFYVSQKLVPMVTDENLLKLYDNPQDLIMEFAKFFTYGISPHE